LESWTDREGKERQTLAIIANNIGLDLTFTAYHRIDREAAARGAAARADNALSDADNPPFEF
jgi:hypothetical protein